MVEVGDLGAIGWWCWTTFCWVQRLCFEVQFCNNYQCAPKRPHSLTLAESTIASFSQLVNCICEWALGQEKTFQCKTAPGVLQSITVNILESGFQCVKNLLATLSISVLGTCSSTHVQAENADQAQDCNIGSLYQDHRMKRPMKCIKNFTSVISFQDQNWKNQAQFELMWVELTLKAMIHRAQQQREDTDIVCPMVKPSANSMLMVIYLRNPKKEYLTVLKLMS